MHKFTHEENKYADDLWEVFGPAGVIGLAFWTGAAIHKDIIGLHGSFPFLVLTGPAGGGKTTLISFLNQTTGIHPQSDDEGFKKEAYVSKGQPTVLELLDDEPYLSTLKERSIRVAVRTIKTQRSVKVINSNLLKITDKLTPSVVRPVILDLFQERFTHYRNDIVLTSNRAVKNYSQVLALLDCMHLIAAISPDRISDAQNLLMQAAIEDSYINRPTFIAGKHRVI